MIQSAVKTPDMAKGRPPIQFELLTELAGFRVTPEQLQWLRSASTEEGETSVSEWLRKLASAAGEKSLGKPFPRRKLLPLKKRGK